MSGQIGLTNKNVATVWVNPSSAPAAPAAPARETVTPSRSAGVLDHGTTYTTAKPANPYSMWNGGKAGGALHAPSSHGGSKIKSGTLKADDLKGMDPTKAAQALDQLALGGKAQQENLRQLMTDPTFAKTLGPAMNQMNPKARQQVLKTAGESAKTPDGAKIAHTLERALDSMTPARRDDTLRDAYVAKGGEAAVAAANTYVSGDSQRATELLNNLGMELAGKPADLGQALGRLDAPAMDSLIKGMSNLPASEAQEQFRTLGDAVSGPPTFHLLRENIGKALERSSINAGVLLGNVARDKYRAHTRGKSPNNGQALAKEILGRMDPRTRQTFMDSLRLVKGAEDVKKLLPPTGDGN
jgi:hypothetical protein